MPNFDQLLEMSLKMQRVAVLQRHGAKKYLETLRRQQDTFPHLFTDGGNHARGNA